jgi:hypothetical protein
LLRVAAQILCAIGSVKLGVDFVKSEVIQIADTNTEKAIQRYLSIFYILLLEFYILFFDF